VIATLAVLASGPPLDPSGAEGRAWLQDELGKAAYQLAKPTWFDIASKAVLDWFQSLFNASSGAAPTVLLVVAIVVVAALIVIAILVFGMPRVNRRSRSTPVALFGDDDRRTAAQLRATARAAAAAGSYSLAVLEGFRAIARGLDERTVVAVLPGTTAAGFARSAASGFPDLAVALADAADRFDRVRYAGRTATAEDWTAIERLDATLAATRPVLEPAAHP
jgi:Domain of unknown function (DUF4129)